MYRRPPAARRGSIIPMMAVCTTVLFGFVALAIDLGMLVVARSAAQDAADAAALTGARTLDNRVPAGTLSDNYDNQSPLATTNAQGSVAKNATENSTTLAVSNVTIGVYDYDTTTQVFRPTYPGTKPTGKAWTAVSVDVTSTQPAYFSRIFGVTSMPTSAHAVAAHRPRDIAIVLDMSGSMKFATSVNWPEPGQGAIQGLMSPDPNYPRFGHYQRYPTTADPSAFYRSTAFTQTSGEIFAPNNFTIDSNVGPAIVRQFAFDPSNLSSPATSVPNISSPTALRNAFHRWNPPGMTPLTANGPFGRMTTPTGYAGYNAFDTSNTSGPTPAPDTFATQEDGAAKYAGDRAPRKAGKYLRDATSWDPTTTTGGAYTVWDLLFPSSVTTKPTPALRPVPATAKAIAPLGITDYRLDAKLVNGLPAAGATAAKEGGTAADWSTFVDGAWEAAGYDLDIWAYTQASGAATVTTDRSAAVAARALDATPTYPTNGRFQGNAMGPAYYGKSFFVWPPDPRWGNPNGGTPLGGGIVRPDQVLATTNTSSTDTSKLVKDSNGNWICDWRRRFFLPSTSVNTGAVTAFTYFDPQTTAINPALLNATAGGAVLKAGGYKINYNAVLAWIKSGPQVFPPNLRAGHIKYYSSIPDNVDNAAAGTATETSLDQRFWREYIDFVLGNTANNGSYDPQYTLAGLEPSTWGSGANATVSLGTTGNEVYTVGTTAYTNPRPYMNYTDVPNRPRAHFWFGPASMVEFLSTRMGKNSYRNFNPGTVSEAQDWQLKVGVQSALQDIKNNHPNDQAGMTYFAHDIAGNGTDDYFGVRAPMGQDWDTLKNALFYPQSLLAGIKSGSAPNAELRPYTSSFGIGLMGDLPNAMGGTAPVTGFAQAYNLCSSASSIPGLLNGGASAGPGTGRRGATKIVIFETDGVPNSYRQFNFTAGGINSYYTSTNTVASPGNGDSTSCNLALDIVDQIVAPTASNGFSLANSSARVYPIGFGDIFSSSSPYLPTALGFLQDVGYHGNTNTSSSTPLPSYQIITGTDQQRIDGLKTTFERILQSGVQVTLIE